MPNGNIGARLQRAVYEDLTLEQLRIDSPNMSDAALKRLLLLMKREVLYRNDLYQVAIDKNPPHGLRGCVVWHLSIKRTDKEPLMDWRDIQTIKNQLLGPEVEMMQLFPAESRLVDTANQYHFFALMKDGRQRQPRLPFGWTERTTSNSPDIMGKQRRHQQEVHLTHDDRMQKINTSYSPEYHTKGQADE